MLRKRRMLGLAVTKRSITAVEVVGANGGGRAGCAAEFVFPEGLAPEEPAAMGKALKGFLREKGFSASHCVLGLEADWLMARDRTLPPGGSDSAAQILSLAVEREFAGDHRQLVFDYALGAEAGGQRSALLVGAPRQVVDQLKAAAEAAGLTVDAVTASTMALAGPGNGSAGDDCLMLHLYAGGAELAVRTGGCLRMMRRLPVSVPADPQAGSDPANGWLGDLADELRRVVSLLPGGEARSDAPRELVIWDEAGLDEEATAALSGRLGLPLSLCPTHPELAPPDHGGPPLRGGQYRAAAVMALDAFRRRRPAIDLLHSRLSPGRRLAIGRKVTWAAAVAAALVVAGGVMAWDWRTNSLEAADLQTRLKELKPEIEDAKVIIDKVTFARPWYSRRPSYLDCVRELTLAFPAEGGVWTTSLAVQEDMQVVFSGKASSESAVLDVLDRLEANDKLLVVNLLYIRDAGRDGRESAFAISFTYTDPEKPWSSPSAKKSSSRRR